MKRPNNKLDVLMYTKYIIYILVTMQGFCKRYQSVAPRKPKFRKMDILYTEHYLTRVSSVE
jgi:hypothetical protein